MLPTRKWTLDEARAALPGIIEITEHAHERSRQLQQHLTKGIRPENEQEGLEDELERVLTQWVEAVQSMGAEVKQLWLVDFDNGRGYYCWQYGESDLLYEHSYEGGFAARKRITTEDQPS